eukprot:GHVR01109744.1.p1 GENE.GHVR01109744.1~~GHVR01109744.1.p1  ORF type:complete len:119 (+),score=3.35 GHVR01109744.1:261-617(+)
MLKTGTRDQDVNLLCWSSKVLKYKLASSCKLELHALMRVIIIKVVPTYIKLALPLTGRKPKIVYEVDSKPLMSQLHSVKVSQLHSVKVRAEPSLQGVLDIYMPRTRTSRCRDTLGIHE